MRDPQDELIDRVVSQAERLEKMDDPSEIDPLETKVTANLNNPKQVSEYELVLTTGGPKIVVEVLSGHVRGHWGGETYRTHFNNEELIGKCAEWLEGKWELRV